MFLLYVICKVNLEKPNINLDKDHLAKDIVYIINEFAKEKLYLFSERNFEGKSCPKFKNELQELLGLQIFATLRLQLLVEKSKYS